MTQAQIDKAIAEGRYRNPKLRERTIPTDTRPGNGWLVMSKKELLKAMGLPSGLEVLGVRWSSVLEEFRIIVRGDEVPWMGGEIVHKTPIRTEKQKRDQ